MCHLADRPFISDKHNSPDSVRSNKPLASCICGQQERSKRIFLVQRQSVSAFALARTRPERLVHRPPATWYRRTKRAATALRTVRPQAEKHVLRCPRQICPRTLNCIDKKKNTKRQRQRQNTGWIRSQKTRLAPERVTKIRTRAMGQSCPTFL
jgi:hypothetical protein